MLVQDLFEIWCSCYVLDDITVEKLIVNKKEISYYNYSKRYSDYTIKRIEFNDENSCSIYIYKKGVKNMTDLEKTETVLEALNLNYRVVKKEKEIELEVYSEFWSFINVLYFNHDESLKERGE